MYVNDQSEVPFSPLTYYISLRAREDYMSRAYFHPIKFELVLTYEFGDWLEMRCGTESPPLLSVRYKSIPE